MPALPRDLEAAHQGLKRWVARALEQYEEEPWFPDRREGRDKIRRFVDVFCEIPRARAELDHRACYAGEQTADGTAYAHAMDKALGALDRWLPPTSEARHESWPGQLATRLGEFAGKAPSLAELKRIDERLTDLLREDVPQETRQLLGNWQYQVREIVAKAEQIGTEGCWWLANRKNLEVLFDSAPFGPGRLVEIATAEAIEAIEYAADLLVAWREQQTAGEAGEGGIREAIAGATEEAPAPVDLGRLADSGNEKRVRADVQHSDDTEQEEPQPKWYHGADEQPPPEFKTSPLQGTKKDLSFCVGGPRDTKNPRKLQAKAEAKQVWVRRVKGRSWDVFFRTQEAFAQANGKMIELQREKSKSAASWIGDGTKTT